MQDITVFEHQAMCPLCGQIMIISTTTPNPSQKELGAEAAAVCACPAATVARGMKATEKAIQRVLGEESVKIGFDYGLEAGTIDAVRAVCKMILLDNIDGVVLREPQGDVIRLIKNGNAVKIRRSSKKQVEM